MVGYYIRAEKSKVLGKVTPKNLRFYILIYLVEICSETKGCNCFLNPRVLTNKYLTEETY